MPRHARRTSKRLIRWTATAGLIGACLAGLSYLLLPDEQGDPTRKGPLRTLSIEASQVTDEGHLVVKGTTNFPDSVKLRLRVMAEGREVASFEVPVSEGRFLLDTQGRGEVLAGKYRVSLGFRIEEQTQAMREELGYQPASLMASAPLSLPVRLVAQAGSRDELKSLIQAVNLEPRDPVALDGLDRRARVLGDRLWIAKEKVAVQKLRLAIEEARRPGQLRRRDFDRLLLEAHVLAGL